MARKVRVSLANKCQLLFGAAVVLILTAALAVVWVRMQGLVIEGHQNTARELAQIFLPDLVVRAETTDETTPLSVDGPNGTRVTLMRLEAAHAAAQQDASLAQALAQFEEKPSRSDLFQPYEYQGKRYLRHIRLVRDARVRRIMQRHQAETDTEPAPDATTSRSGDTATDDDRIVETTDGVEAQSRLNPPRMVLLVRVPSAEAEKQLMLNRIYLVTAGLVAGLLAIAVFWYITRRIILSPVRLLRNYAEQVSEGDLHIRSEINTGDEFEQLSDVFNTMLENLKKNADQLRMTNKSLDLKLGELAETNVALYEANKIKGEFLANVSHELRTPLNSIVGFAEVLQETLADETGPMNDKRKRYVANIITSSRRLLDLINDLLDLAKIEAGRMEVHVSGMSVMDTAEGLLNLIRPQAAKRQIDLRLKIEPGIPVVQTDAGKVQQILFNFLSNAVKFTPEGGTITLSANLVESPEGQEPTHVRISVSDTGPGIAPEDHERIFDKFTQLAHGVTKEHGGTGLGLTISRDLARLLQGRIELVSDIGRGATFSLIIPLVLEPQTVPLMPT